MTSTKSSIKIKSLVCLYLFDYLKEVLMINILVREKRMLLKNISIDI